MKILFIYDVENWSFHNIATNIQAASIRRGLGHEFRLRSRDEWAGRPKQLLEDLAWADLHVFFWRFDLLAAIDMLDAASQTKDAVRDILASKITLSIVYDHLYLEESELEVIGNPFAISDFNAVCSGSLAEIYTNSDHLFRPDAVLIDGVDLDRFQPPETTDGTLTPLTVGWVGNSDWGAHTGPDMKGFHTVFLPSVQGLIASKNAVTAIADKATSPVPAQDMPEFYHQIDVLACTSQIEGTPNPVLEAMASGAAIVSTDVGVVREVLGPLQQDFITERSPEAFGNKLEVLARDRVLLEALKNENIQRRKLLSWDARLDAWQAVFQEAQQVIGCPDRIAAKRHKLEKLLSAPKGRLATIRRHIMANRPAYACYMFMLGRFPHVTARLRNMLK